MPPLVNSDTSRGGEYDTNGSMNSHHSSILSDHSEPSTGVRRSQQRRRRHKHKAITTTTMTEKSVTSSHRSRSKSRTRSRSNTRPHRSRSRSRPRSTVTIASSSVVRSRSRSRPRRSQQPQTELTTTTTTSSAPTIPSSRSHSRSRRRRTQRGDHTSNNKTPRSYSRCTSLGGTTLYRTPHMAKLDAYLHSTSGLRLQMDGTCNFVFEYQRFVVETAAYEDNDEDDNSDTNDDYLFYASFGGLGELQRKVRPMNLLRLLATWNEGLKQRRENEYDNVDDEVTGVRKKKNTGLLRIDSSKADGPHVAFIYYGHVGEIEDAVHFQEAMDDFVDDALEFSDMLHGAEMIDEEEQHQHHHHQQEYMERSSRIAAVVSSPSDLRSGQRQHHGDAGHDSDDGSSYFDESASANNINSNDVTTITTKQPSQKETTNNNNNTPPPINPAITTSDVYHANNKKSVFSKMIKSIRSKSNNKDNNIGSLAFVDPSNPGCAFVVDKNAADEGMNIKPTIVLSRKIEPSSFQDGGTTTATTTTLPAKKRGSSFHDSGNAPNTTRKGGSSSSTSTSFHSRGDSPPYHRDNRGFSHNSRDSDEKVRGDNNRISRRSSRAKKSSLSSSFSTSEYNNNINNNNYPNISNKVKSKSFHDHHSRKRSSVLTEERESDYERSSGQSVSRSSFGAIYATQFARSEPAMGASRNRRSEGDNASSRRHSSEVSQHHQQQQQRGQHRRHSKRPTHDEDRRGGTSKSRGERSRRGSRGMNRSEPTMPMQQQRNSSSPLYM